jgi:hypothetical protein
MVLLPTAWSPPALTLPRFVPGARTDSVPGGPRLNIRYCVLRN